MPNYTPLAEGAQASGGYLVRPVYQETLMLGLQRESAVFKVANLTRVGTNKVIHSEYVGRPTAAFVAESGDKPVTGAEFAELTINIKKIATTVLFTEEMLDDAVEDPRRFVGPDVVGAITDLIDQHALGMAGASQVTTSFDAMLRSTTANVELGTTGDAFAIAVSAAMSTIEGNGYTPTAILAASDMRGLLRDARATTETTTPVFTQGYQREPDTVYGLPIVWTSNLDALPAGANKIAAIVLDGRQALGAIRNDIRVKTSDQATVTVGGTPRNLWQKNETAILWETRIGFNVHDINRSVVRIMNAS